MPKMLVLPSAASQAATRRTMLLLEFEIPTTLATLLLALIPSITK